MLPDELAPIENCRYKHWFYKYLNLFISCPLKFDMRFMNENVLNWQDFFVCICIFLRWMISRSCYCDKVPSHYQQAGLKCIYLQDQWGILYSVPDSKLIGHVTVSKHAQRYVYKPDMGQHFAWSSKRCSESRFSMCPVQGCL